MFEKCLTCIFGRQKFISFFIPHTNDRDERRREKKKHTTNYCYKHNKKELAQLLSHLVEECHEYEHITDTEFLVHL